MNRATLRQSAEKPSEIGVGAASSVDHFALAWHFGNSNSSDPRYLQQLQRLLRLK
jgi:hypothetical protein